MKFKFLPVVLFVFIVLFFFSPFIFQAKSPIPSDTIVGLYHPFRDLYSEDYPNGIPFKNFLITDPVRQQYPWRELAVSEIKNFELPLWNPYNFSGIPLLANMQSAALYPLNIIFFIFPFSFAWGILIVVEPLLAGLFLYFYLNNLKLNKLASLLGGVSFAFSGFFVAWLEWGNILHVAIWLPLILLSIDKIFLLSQRHKFSIFNFQFSILKWGFILVFSLTSSFFAGHLQIFFYLFLLSLLYFGVRWIQFGKLKNVLILFLILNSLFIILTSIQWIPTIQFILQSARDIDQNNWQQPGWFIPWQHLIQFVAPDFFGNPTTLNYWGVWNYGEFVGYVGIGPLIMAFYALFFRHDKKTLFFGTIFFISLIFSLPTIFGKLPFVLNIPFLSTAQPTRLLYLTDFSLAILAAFGFDHFIRKRRGIFYPVSFIGIVILGLWVFVFFGSNVLPLSTDNLAVAKRNLYLPASIYIAIAFLLLLLKFRSKIKFLRGQRFTIMIYIIIVGVTIFDLLRFGFKFTPFTEKKYLFPQTKIISFLQENLRNHRFMSTDSRIFPPNFSSVYRLQSVDGYDPLFLRSYAEMIAASERGRPDISPPFGFNRIITPQNFESKIIDLLGVKYILSLTELESPKLTKVFQEGETRVYENNYVIPRAFFVKGIKVVSDRKEAINMLFEGDFDFRETAVIEDSRGVNTLSHPMCDSDRCEVEIVSYHENRIIIETSTDNYGFLVLTDSFYPSWHAKINDAETPIFRTNYNFRGVVVPEGRQTVEFYNSLL